MAKSKKEIKVSKKLVVGILAVLVLAFVAYFLINGNITGEVVATVNGQKITSDEVDMVQQAYLQQGRQISEEDAIEQAISQEVLSQKVQQEGITVTTEEAESIIGQQLSAQGMTLEDYKQQIEAQGINYQDELENFKDQISIQSYLESEFENQAFEVSEEEAKEFYEMYEQQAPGEIPSYEEIEAQIIMQLERQKQQEATNVLIQELRSNADIEYK